MDTRQWLNELETELFQRRLPRRYVTRLVRELSDHVLDDREKVMSTDAPMLPGAEERLGLPRTVAATAEHEYQRRRFAARFPLLTFVVAPVLIFPFLAAVVFAGPGWVLATMLPMMGVGLEEAAAGPTWVPLAARCYAASALIVAAGILIALTCRLARRSAVPGKWPLVTGVLVALVCGCVFSDATAKTPDRKGTVMVGIGFPLRSLTVYQIVQFAAPLGLAAWLVKRSRRVEGGFDAVS